MMEYTCDTCHTTYAKEYGYLYHMDTRHRVREEPPVIENLNGITRLDRHTLSVNGVWIPANEDQERRIRALTPKQLAALLKILGRDTVGKDADGVVIQSANGQTIRAENGFQKPIV